MRGFPLLPPRPLWERGARGVRGFPLLPPRPSWERGAGGVRAASTSSSATHPGNASSCRKKSSLPAAIPPSPVRLTQRRASGSSQHSPTPTPPSGKTISAPCTPPKAPAASCVAVGNTPIPVAATSTPTPCSPSASAPCSTLADGPVSSCQPASPPTPPTNSSSPTWWKRGNWSACLILKTAKKSFQQ